MSDNSKIEWTDATWNPIRGCSRVSEGCRNCYAEQIAARFSGPDQPYEGLAKRVTVTRGELKGNPPLAKVVTETRWTGDVRFIPDLLAQPLHWKRPRKIFVNSMSDLFHEKVHGDWIDLIFGVMNRCPQHTFQILTKRPERMRAFLRHYQPTDNVWLGVSVEDQKTADERIPLLLQTPAAVRWVSYEPALGGINFHCIKEAVAASEDCEAHDNYFDALWGYRSLGPKIDWIVAGGESGPAARPAHPDWFHIARQQCQQAGVPFFFKQFGEWLHATQMEYAFTETELGQLTFRTVCRDTGKGDLYFRVGKKRAGHLLDGEVWQQFPKRP